MFSKNRVLTFVVVLRNKTGGPYTKDVMERMAQTRDLEANPLREHEQLKDASAYIYKNLMSWSNLHLSIYKLQ